MIFRIFFQAIFLLVFFSCKQEESQKAFEQKNNLPISTAASESGDTSLRTWASHNKHGFQLLELKDSTNGVIYFFSDDKGSNKKPPYYFKAKAIVTVWNQHQLSISTDKFNFYYSILHDTLIMKDEAGVREKLVRIHNDPVMRNQR